MSCFHLRLSVQHLPSSHFPDNISWPFSTVVDCVPSRPYTILQSNYHEFAVRKVFLSISLKSSLSFQPIRGSQTSMDAGEIFTSCNTCWSKDGLKSIQMQNLSNKAQVLPCCSSYECSNYEDKEEQRRRKIGLANKGRVPWNKGRKHTAETRLRIKQRTVEALRDPKVRKRMTEHPRTHSEQSKARIGSSLRRVWSKRLKQKRLGERFFISWLESIAEAAMKGGSDQSELDWDSYDKIKQEIALEQLQWAKEKAKQKEMAKVRAATVKAEKIARMDQKRKEREKKEKERKLMRKSQEKAKKDGEVADSQELKLKQRLTMIRKRKSINGHVSIQGDTVQIPALEKLNIERIKKEKMQNEISLAEQIRAAKSKRAVSISPKLLAVSSSFSHMVPD